MLLKDSSVPCSYSHFQITPLTLSDFFCLSSKNGDGICDPNNEIEWHNAGTFSGTATKWLCYATDPANEIYKFREVAELCSASQIAPPDTLASVKIITTDGIGAVQADGR